MKDIKYLGELGTFTIIQNIIDLKSLVENINERLTFIEEKFEINYCTVSISFKGIVFGSAYVIFNNKLHLVKFGEVIKVPYNTSVMVSGADVEGYITPPTITFIPTESTKNIELEYVPAFYITFNIIGSSECRAVINYETLAGTQTKTVYNGDRVAVPNYCTVQIEPQEQYGYDAPQPQSIYMDEPEKTVDIDFVAKLCNVTMRLEGLGSAYLLSARGTISWTGNSVTLRDGASTQIPFNTICMIEGNSLWGSYSAPPPEQIIIDNLDYTAIIKYK